MKSGNVVVAWFGEMAEWLKATVSKTVVPVSGTVGSNPTLSATFAGKARGDPRAGHPSTEAAASRRRRGAGAAEQARLESV